MITDALEFRQKLQEIQNSTDVTFTNLPSDEPRFIIDANSRSISIPSEFSFLGIKNDHNAENIYFEIDRYFDDVDLSEKTCIVQFITNGDTAKKEGIYPCTSMDIESVEGKILFCWTIQSDVTQDDGDVAFSVRFYSINDDNEFAYSFNTLSSKLPILDTLDVKESSSASYAPSELDLIIEKFDESAQEVVDMNNETRTLLQTVEERQNEYDEKFEKMETATVSEIKSYLNI